MKLVLVAAATVALAFPAFAQSGGNTQGRSMQGMDRGMDQGMDQGMAMVDGEGVVKAVDPKAGSITIQMTAPGQSPMTMTVKAANPALLQNVSVGQSVGFVLMKMGDAVTLTAIQPK